MVTIWSSCLKLLQMTCSSCLLHFFLYLLWWSSCLRLTLLSFSITISTLSYRAFMFNSQRICARVVLIVGSIKDGENLLRSRCAWGGIFCLSWLAWGWETHWEVLWMDSLRSSVDVWSTREESFASFMVCWGLWGRSFLAGDFFFFFWVYWTHWGKIFYFLTGNTLGKNLLIPHWGLFKCSWANQGRIFCLLHRDDIHYGKNF